MAETKTRICYILPFYEEGTDTHLFYNYELIKKLAARSEDIYLIIEKSPKLSLGKIKQNLGISNCYMQIFSFPLFRFLELLFKCFMLRLQGYANFYVHYSYYGALAAWLATWLSGSQVRVFYWNRGMPWLFKRGWIEEKVFRFILRNTILVTGPESLAKEYIEHYGVREYRVLSNWVDVERFSPSASTSKNLLKAQALQDLAQGDGSDLPAGRQGRAIRQQANKDVRFVLFVHHLSKRKGADLIPDIAKGFGDDVLFLVAGDGPEFENLKLKIENLNISNVNLLGKVSNAEIPAYFKTADILLMPSREEGSPHVILEAMASGVPFVASDVGGVRELVPRELEAFLCPSEDVKCFQDKIKTLLSESELYENMRAQCLEYAKKFDITRGVNEFMNLFN